MELPPLPKGLERRVVLTRDGSPLLEMVKSPGGEFLRGSCDKDSMAWDWKKPSSGSIWTILA